MYKQAVHVVHTPICTLLLVVFNIMFSPSVPLVWDLVVEDQTSVFTVHIIISNIHLLYLQLPECKFERYGGIYSVKLHKCPTLTVSDNYAICSFH